MHEKTRNCVEKPFFRQVKNTAHAERDYLASTAAGLAFSALDFGRNLFGFPLLFYRDCRFIELCRVQLCFKRKKQARARNQHHKERLQTHAPLRAACHTLYAAARPRRGVSASCSEVTTRSETLKKQDWGKPLEATATPGQAIHITPDGETQRYVKKYATIGKLAQRRAHSCRGWAETSSL